MMRKRRVYEPRENLQQEIDYKIEENIAIQQKIEFEVNNKVERVPSTMCQVVNTKTTH